jgi:hypothetical protein
VIAKEKRIDERNVGLSQAWHAAAWQRTKQMPSLEKVLTVEPKRQTVSEQRSMLEALSKTIGIPLRKAARTVAHGV